MSTIASNVLPLLRETRKISLPMWGNPGRVDRKSSDPVDVVTEADRAIESFLSEGLRKIDSAAFVGEEFGGERGDRYWLCDPIDGTGLFARGMPLCTTMLALVEGGIVTFGAIYDFVNDHLYFASRGKGAFKNDVPIRVSERSLKESYVGWESRAASPEHELLLKKLRKKSALIKFMCCGMEFAFIAEGKMDGRVCIDPWGHDWDYAAGPLIIEEAGGVVANIGKTTYELSNRDFIAANPKVFEALTNGDDALFRIS